MRNIARITYFILFLLFHSSFFAESPVRVFILAGQSNMEGKGGIDPLLNHQIQAAETKDFFAHLHRDGDYIERDDVWIDYLGRRGNLSVGYGSPGKIGPELEFGNTMGDELTEQVLLIKTAWGGKSIGRDFRSPSSGIPSNEKIDEFVMSMAKRDHNNRVKQKWNQLKKEDPKASRKEAEAQVEKSIDEILREKSEQYRKEVIESHGHFYRLMMKEVEDCLSSLKTRFPTYEGQGYEISGFVWFQGWNDMYNGFQNEYAKNIKNLINDIRKDLGKPQLPVVIGIMGQNGFKEATGNMAIVKSAQASMNEVNAFKGNVRAIPTDVYWDKKADEAFPTWRDNFEEWQKIGSDRPYHYLGSTIFFSRVGRGFGETMLKLIKQN
ncbi:MAG: sialate O-acetylesterase [Opitutales bacterium]|nr:sialate O-acetylesterase [Opitutales bacterium]